MNADGNLPMAEGSGAVIRKGRGGGGQCQVDNHTFTLRFFPKPIHFFGSMNVQYYFENQTTHRPVTCPYFWYNAVQGNRSQLPCITHFGFPVNVHDVRCDEVEIVR